MGTEFSLHHISSIIPVSYRYILRSDIMKRVVKCVLAGPGAVGKSTFLAQLTGNKKIEDIRMTPGLDIDVYNLPGDIILQIWDLGGQKQFRFMQEDFIRKADIIIYMYSVDWLHSYLNLDDWINFVAMAAERSKIQYLIGNKIDSKDRVVTYEEGKDMAENLEFRYFEISALENIGIKELIADINEEIMRLTTIQGMITGNLTNLKDV